MKTFLPYSDFVKSADILDRARLGKQRIETYQILRTLRGVSAGWANHPAVKMWRGSENALVNYGLVICDEWIRRGYKDTTRPKIEALFDPKEMATMPTWLGDEAVHSAFRSNLLRKDPIWYGKYGWTEGPGLAYVWPGIKMTPVPPAGEAAEIRPSSAHHPIHASPAAAHLR